MSGAEHESAERLEINGIEVRPPGPGAVVGIPSTVASLAYIVVAAYGSHAAGVLAAIVAGVLTLGLVWILRVAMLSRIRQQMYADTVVIRERR